MRRIKRTNVGKHQPPHPFTVELAAGASMPEETVLVEMAPYKFHPGEEARIRDNVRVSTDDAAAIEARSRLSGRDLTVAETILEVMDGPFARVWYRFEGVDGRFIAQAVGEPGEMMECYGVMLRHGEDIMLVALDGVDGKAVGTPMKVTALGRPASHYLFGEDGHALEDVLEIDGAPISGEFVVNSRDGGETWAFAATGFTASVSEVELTAARSAIEAAPNLPHQGLQL